MVVTKHVRSSRPSTRRLVGIGALAGALAAIGTTVVAVVASVADVSLEVRCTDSSRHGLRVYDRLRALRLRSHPQRANLSVEFAKVRRTAQHDPADQVRHDAVYSKLRLPRCLLAG